MFLKGKFEILPKWGPADPRQAPADLKNETTKPYLVSVIGHPLLIILRLNNLHLLTT